MAKNWGRLVLFAAAAGAAAAGTYYYLQKHKKAADPECEAYDGDAAADDDFEDDDFFDDDFEDEEEDCEKKDTSRIFTAGTNAQGHAYVTLDLKAASDKAANLCDNVATKFGEAVQKLKNNYLSPSRRFYLLPMALPCVVLNQTSLSDTPLCLPP